MTSRERVLWEIAERYEELVDPMCGPAAIRGDGESVGLMPGTYTPTVREFERLLGVMRNQAKQKAFRGHSLGKLRWHLVEWHIKAVRTVKYEKVVEKKHGKKVRLLFDADGSQTTRPVIRFTRDRDAREPLARAAIAWMSENWGLMSEPMLPDEIRINKAA